MTSVFSVVKSSATRSFFKEPFSHQLCYNERTFKKESESCKVFREVGIF